MGVRTMVESLEKAKETRHWLKLEWKDLWINKYEDDVKGEGVSLKDYTLIEVDRGEIIYATRDYKRRSFRDILEKYLDKEEVERVDIDPQTGGWKKFAKENFPGKKEKIKREKPVIKNDLSQQQRKHGFGWQNQARIYKKKRENKGY